MLTCLAPWCVCAGASAGALPYVYVYPGEEPGRSEASFRSPGGKRRIAWADSAAAAAATAVRKIHSSLQAAMEGKEKLLFAARDRVRGVALDRSTVAVVILGSNGRQDAPTQAT